MYVCYEHTRMPEAKISAKVFSALQKPFATNLLDECK